MKIHLFLEIVISIGIILALTKKYIKPGLLLLGIVFLVKSVFTFWVDRDVVLGMFEVFASCTALYEYGKAVRHDYTFTKWGRLIAGILFISLGAWMLALGTFSPILIAGVVSVFIILVQDYLPPKKPAQKV
jgi:hypothetical protein